MTTAAELVPVENLAELETLDPATREIAVTHMLGEARGWLAHALESTGPKQMAEFKAFVATIAETTKQLNLSKEIQLDAVEMVRRAERGVGLAIRRGQGEGAIATKEDSLIPGGPNGKAALEGGNPSFQKSSPTDYVSRNDLSGGGSTTGIYDLTDDISDDEFDRALDEAKDEGNLSRANVVRKAKGEDKPKPPGRPEHLRGMRHIDPNRVMRETVIATEGVHFTLDILEPHHYQQLNEEDVVLWVSSLTDSIRALNRLNRILKELTHDRV